MFKRIIIIILIGLWINDGFCSQQTDSLETLINSGAVTSDLKKCEILNQLSRGYFNISVNQAVDYGVQALEIAYRIDNDQQIALALKNIGSAYYLQGDFMQALEFFKQALRKNTEIDDKNEIAASYNNIGLVYNRLGNYDEALKNHLNQHKINEETENQRGIAISSRNIGNIYNNMGENDKALEYYRRSKEISGQLGDTNSLATALINLGVVTMDLEDYQKSQDFFNQALIIKKRMDDITNIAVIYLNLGVIQRNMGEHEKAIEYYLQGLELYRSLNNKYGIVVSLNNLGAVYLNLEKYPESYGFLQEALAIATEIDNKKHIQEIYKNLSSWYSDQKKFEEALEYFKLQSALKDSLLDIEKSKQIRNIQIVYETEKKEKEILEQRISIQKLKTYQVYLLLAIFVALTIVFVVYYRYRLKKKANRYLEVKIAEALIKQNEQQQIIVHQASLTSLGELAAGIAHEIRQPLQSISLSSESLDMENKEEEPDRKYIDKTLKEIYEDIKRIKFIINEISNFSRGQQAPLNEFFDVNLRIKNAFSLARTKFSNRQIDVRFDLDDKVPEIRGNPYKFEQVIVNFFNNARDAMEEKAEKSDKDFDKILSVKSYFENEIVHVEVRDNGIGVPEHMLTNIFLPFFTTKAIGKGTGLGLSISLGIVKEMNGSIEMESTEMEGTLMRLTIPVSNK